MENSGVTYSVGDIINRYKSPEYHVSVLDFMQNQIRLMRKANRLGTALNYEKTMKNFAEFLGGVNLQFSAMTENLLLIIMPSRAARDGEKLHLILYAYNASCLQQSC